MLTTLIKKLFKIIIFGLVFLVFSVGYRFISQMFSDTDRKSFLADQAIADDPPPRSGGEGESGEAGDS